MDERLCQLKNDDSIGWAWAAAELAGYKDEPGIVEGLVDTARSDGFWAVRLSAAEAALKQIDSKNQNDAMMTSV